MFDAIKRYFGGDFAQTSIDVQKLDMNVVRKYRSMGAALEVLDQWVLSPDKDLVKQLGRLSEQIHRIQPYARPTELYRGVEVSRWGHQNQMGMTSKPGVGKVIQFWVGAPMSFTTDRKIAEDFGDTVVKITKIDSRHPFLAITDELSFVLSELRGTDPATQREVILLPGQMPISAVVL